MKDENQLIVNTIINNNSNNCNVEISQESKEQKTENDTSIPPVGTESNDQFNQKKGKSYICFLVVSILIFFVGITIILISTQKFNKSGNLKNFENIQISEEHKKIIGNSTYLSSCNNIVVETISNDSLKKSQVLENKDSALSIININDSIEYIIKKLNSTNYADRRKILEYPGIWQLLKPKCWEWCLFALILIVVLAFMFFSYKVQHQVCKKDDFNRGDCGEPFVDDLSHLSKNDCEYTYLQYKKQFNPVGLLLRDLGSIAYDGTNHTERAEVREYRGFLHWHRDISEKFLSILLVVFFSFYLVRILKYFISLATAETWYLTLMPIEINFVLSLIGFSIIIDGFIIFGAMTDAPGIGKILDSMIVILAGVVLLLVEATPGERSIVAFSVSNYKLLIGISGIISLLYLTKWIVKHHTINELIGKRLKGEE